MSVCIFYCHVGTTFTRSSTMWRHYEMKVALFTFLFTRETVFVFVILSVHQSLSFCHFPFSHSVSPDNKSDYRSKMVCRCHFMWTFLASFWVHQRQLGNSFVLSFYCTLQSSLKTTTEQRKESPTSFLCSRVPAGDLSSRHWKLKANVIFFGLFIRNCNKNDG